MHLCVVKIWPMHVMHHSTVNCKKHKSSFLQHKAQCHLTNKCKNIHFELDLNCIVHDCYAHVAKDHGLDKQRLVAQKRWLAANPAAAEVLKKWDGGYTPRERGLEGGVLSPQLYGVRGITSENFWKYRDKSGQIGAFLATSATENIQFSI